MRFEDDDYIYYFGDEIRYDDELWDEIERRAEEYNKKYAATDNTDYGIYDEHDRNRREKENTEYSRFYENETRELLILYFAKCNVFVIIVL